MSTSPTEYLLHIRDEMNYLRQATANVSLDSFLQDETLKRAVVRSLEVISAAAASLPDDFRRRHPTVDWHRLTAINDRLIHDVFGTDYELVWDVTVTTPPRLANDIEKILAEEEWE